MLPNTAKTNIGKERPSTEQRINYDKERKEGEWKGKEVKKGGRGRKGRGRRQKEVGVKEHERKEDKERDQEIMCKNSILQHNSSGLHFSKSVALEIPHIAVQKCSPADNQ